MRRGCLIPPLRAVSIRSGTAQAALSRQPRGTAAKIASISSCDAGSGTGAGTLGEKDVKAIGLGPANEWSCSADQREPVSELSRVEPIVESILSINGGSIGCIPALRSIQPVGEKHIIASV